MKKYNNFLTIFFSILLSVTLSINVSAQSGSLSDFLPLQTGNIWVYQCTTNGSMCGGCSGKVRIVLTGDTIVNGKSYKRSATTSSAISGACQYCGNLGLIPLSECRFDLQNGNVYQLSNPGCSYSPGEMMIDSFRAKLGDTITANCAPPSQNRAYICTDTNSAIVLGANRQARFFNNNGFEGSYYRKYAKGIGLYHAYLHGLDGGTYYCTRQMILLGCVINGVKYGDTSMLVGINQISNEVPERYLLMQNYPNPFNPVTKIQYALPENAVVKFTVYDVLGKEVETLVDKIQTAGYYEAEWNAADYPSGVYYYKLSAGDYTETKKMVLMK